MKRFITVLAMAVFTIMAAASCSLDAPVRAVKAEKGSSQDLYEVLSPWANVDPIPLHKDELLHLGVPPSGLVTEVNARFKKLTYRYDRHFIPPRASVGFRRLRLFSGGTQSGTSSENREACELKVKRSLLSFATKTRRHEVLPILEVFSVPLCLGGWSVIFRSPASPTSRISSASC